MTRNADPLAGMLVPLAVRAHYREIVKADSEQARTRLITQLAPREVPAVSRLAAADGDRVVLQALEAVAARTRLPRHVTAPTEAEQDLDDTERAAVDTYRAAAAHPVDRLRAVTQTRRLPPSEPRHERLTDLQSAWWGALNDLDPQLTSTAGRAYAERQRSAWFATQLAMLWGAVFRAGYTVYDPEFDGHPQGRRGGWLT